MRGEEWGWVGMGERGYGDIPIGCCYLPVALTSSFKQPPPPPPQRNSFSRGVAIEFYVISTIIKKIYLLRNKCYIDTFITKLVMAKAYIGLLQ